MTETFQEFWVGEELGSDHIIIIASFSHQGISYKVPAKQIYLYHKADWQAINKNIEYDMQHHHINHKSAHQDINIYTAALWNTINRHINENVKKITIQPNKIGLPPFIRELINDKHKIRKLYERTRLNHYITQYNQLNKNIKALIKRERRTNWENKCNDLE